MRNPYFPMICYFDSGGANPPTIAPAPSDTNAKTQQDMDTAAAKAKLLAAKRKGAASTLVTGGTGDTTKPSTSRPSILGLEGGSLGQSGAKSQLGN